MIKENNYCVIMAGGVGSRFWPMSRTSLPKQFHDILGAGQTLIQMTFSRFEKICPPENIYIVTNARYKDLVMEQLPNIKEDQVLCEPYMRNTAPCIAYANAVIESECSNARIIVAPSDHLVLKEQDFVETINVALEECESKNLVTLGIKPSRPDTGYGYIQYIDLPEAKNDSIKKVKTFTEKPTLEIAQSFIASGDFAWNSGIFIWSLANIQDAFSAYLPEIYRSFQSIADKIGTTEEKAAVDEVYASCENISIDYGIMEKAKNVSVVLSDFGWSDLGTWGSLYTHLDLDMYNNAAVGKDLYLHNCTNNMVYNQTGKIMVLHGLDDFIVVDTEKALLVCKKDDEQKIKQFVNDIKLKKGEDYV